LTALEIVGVLFLGLLVFFIGWSLDRRRNLRESPRLEAVEENMSENEARTPAPIQEPKTPEERKALLAQAVANWVHKGWRVESQTDFQAVMVKGHRPNHILHLILTIITLGIWAIVWILLTLLGGEKRAVVSVDEYGNTLAQ
jgi:hypothetical protein